MKRDNKGVDSTGMVRSVLNQQSALFFFLFVVLVFLVTIGLVPSRRTVWNTAMRSNSPTARDNLVIAPAGESQATTDLSLRSTGSTQAPFALVAATPPSSSRGEEESKRLSSTLPVPRYMRALEDHFNFSLSFSFSQRTVDRALGPLGINMTLATRLKTEEGHPTYQEAPRTMSDESVGAPTAVGRLLGSEYIDGRYGLTNVLMCVASMLAYAGIDNRAVVFPMRSPIQVENLLDLPETEAMLKSVNVVQLLNNSQFFELGLTRSDRVRAKKLRLSMGSRENIGSLDVGVAQKALEELHSVMHRTAKFRFLVQSSFFLRFPFRSTTPFDACYYIRRMVFHRNIRDSAVRLLTLLKERYHVERLMAVHLRLEFDSAILDPKTANLEPTELTRFFTEDLIPVALAAKADGIYISSGKLKSEFVEAIQNASRTTGQQTFPIVFKDEFRKELSVDEDNAMTTSHTAAAMDTLILASSTLAVSFQGSTLSLAVASHRCPSPGVGVNASYRTFLQDSAASALGPLPRNQHFDEVVTPRDGKKAIDHSFFGYRFDGGKPGEGVRFTRLHYISCDRPVGSQCFYHGLRPEEQLDVRRGGKVPVVGDDLDIPA